MRIDKNNSLLVASLIAVISWNIYRSVNASVCPVSTDKKSDCGGKTQTECLNRGCCWNYRRTSRRYTACSFPTSDTRPFCDVVSSNRRDCKKNNPRDCEAEGCCWTTNTTTGTPKCFVSRQLPEESMVTKASDKMNYGGVMVNKPSILVSVNTCGNAVVSLMESLFTEIGMAFRLTFGYQKNMKRIRVEKIQDGKPLIQVVKDLPENFIECDKDSTLFISWYNRTIFIGKSFESYQYNITDETSGSFNIHTVGLSKIGTGAALWRFLSNPGAETYYKMTARPKADFSTYWLEPVFKTNGDSSISYFIRVRATHVLAIAVSEQKNQTSQKTLMIRIGTSNNSKTEMQEIGKRKKIKGTPNIMDPAKNLDVFLNFVPYRSGGSMWSCRLNLHKQKTRFFMFQYIYFKPYFIGITLENKNKVNGSFWRTEGERFYTLKTSQNGMYSKESFVNFKTNYMVFGVLACRNARVNLYTFRDKYVLRLGGNNNDQISLTYTDAGGTKQTKTNLVNNPLSCAETRFFWVHYTANKGNSVLRWGEGRVSNSRQVNSIQGPLEGIQRASFTAEIKDIDVRWFLSSQSVVSELDVLIPNNYLYGNVWIPRSTAMTFYLTTCTRFEISLTTYFEITTTNSYIMKLGEDNGATQYNEIKIMPDGIVKTRSWEQAYACNERTEYQLKFDTTEIMLLDKKSDRLILGGPAVNNYKINFVAITTGYPGAGDDNSLFEYMKSPNADKIYILNLTPATNWNGVDFLMSTNVLYFSVRTCSKGYIFLYDIANRNRTTFEFRFVYNSLSLYQNGSQLRSVISRSLLTGCDFFINYGILIDQSNLKISAGRYINFYSPLISYEIKNKNSINAISFSSNAPTSTWRVQRKMVEMVKYKSDGTNVIRALGASEFLFPYVVLKIQAASDAQIVFLERSFGDVQHRQVIVTLQDKAGKSTILEFLANANSTYEVRATSYEKDLLSDGESRYFWISWYSGDIAVGKGNFPGLNRFLEWKNPAHYTFKTLSIQMANEAEGTWEMFQNEYDSFVYLTDGSSLKSSIIITPIVKRFDFLVRSCSDVQIGLFSDLDIQEVSYKVVLDSTFYLRSSVRRTYVNRGLSGDKKNVLTTNFLDCSEFTSITIFWSPTTQIIGVRGRSQRYTYHDEDEFLPVETLSVSTLRFTGTFRFAKISGASILLRSNGSELRDGQLWSDVHSSKEISFRVKAIDSVRIILTEYLQNINSDTYVVQISTHKITFFKNLIETCDSVPQPNVLDGVSYKHFWISWKNGKLIMGLGVVPETHVIPDLECKVDTSINSVGFNTFNNKRGDWQFTGDKARSYQFWTEKASDNSMIPWTSHLAITRSTGFNFKIETKEWIAILLAKNPSNYSRDALEIHIDRLLADGKSRTSLFKYVDNPSEIAVKYRQILTKGSVRPLWVSWFDNIVKVGEGPRINEGFVLMTLPSPLPFDVGGVAFATPRETARWVIPQNEVDYLSLNVKNERYDTSRVEMTSIADTSIVFKVQACEDARVSLMQQSGIITRDSITVVFGFLKNKNTVILDGNQRPIYSKETPDVLSCLEKRTFWIDWGDSNLFLAGKGGVVGENTIIDTENSFGIDVNFLGFHVDGSSEGTFDIVNRKGSAYLIFTNSSITNTNIQLEPAENSFEFRVKSCSYVNILLSSMRDISEGIRVTIGTDNNQATSIQNTKIQDNSVVTATRNILNCNESRQFWISYSSISVSVGYGSLPTESSKISQLFLRNSEPITYNRALLYSTFTSTAQWKIGKRNVKSGNFKNIQNSYDNVWRIVQGYKALAFNVYACVDAKIALARVPGRATLMSYEIVIESDHVVLRDGETKLIIKDSHVSNLLSCIDVSEFWISWDRSTLEVGRGSTIYYDTVLSYTFDKPLDINGVGFTSSSNEPGTWSLLKELPYNSPLKTSSVQPSSSIKVTDPPSAPPPVSLVTPFSSPVPPPVPTDDAKTPNNSGGLSAGQKVGISFGVIIPLLAVIVIAVVFYVKKKQERINYESFGNPMKEFSKENK